MYLHILLAIYLSVYLSIYDYLSLNAIDSRVRHGRLLRVFRWATSSVSGLNFGSVISGFSVRGIGFDLAFRCSAGSRIFVVWDLLSRVC